MKAIAAATLAAAALSPVSSFAPVVSNTISRQNQNSISLQASSGDKEPTVCDIPTEFADDSSSSLVGVRNGANAIRSAVVTNADGIFIRLDDAMSNNKPEIVIYLRHMG